MIHLQPMSSTSMPLFDSLSRILYLLGVMEDATTVEMIAVNAKIVFGNMLFRFNREKGKESKQFSESNLYLRGFSPFVNI